MEKLQLAFRVSRFRFWLYLGGTYFTGYIIGARELADFASIDLLYHLFYFMIPANIFLYGINDLFDQDTDKYNVKKEEKEIRIEESHEQSLTQVLILTQLFSVVALLLQDDWTQRWIFLIFIFLSFAYSSPPFRFKARPFIDFSSNILYALPGIFGYYQISQQLPHVLIVFALFLWTGAMHLFSAVPDIDSDEQAGLTTTAVLLGKDISLWICFFFWLVCIGITVLIFGAFTPWGYLGFLYPLIPLALILKPDMDIDTIYWLYPYINGVLGFLISVLAGWDLLGELLTIM